MGQLLKFCNDYLRDDKFVVTQALRAPKRGIVFKYASKELRDDFDMALTAIKYDFRSYRFASKRLKKSPNFMRRAMTIDPFIYRYFNCDNKLSKSLFTRWIAKLNYLQLLRINSKYHELIDSNLLTSDELAHIYTCLSHDISNIFEKAKMKKFIIGERDVSERQLRIAYMQIKPYIL